MGSGREVNYWPRVFPARKLSANNSGTTYLAMVPAGCEVGRQSYRAVSGGVAPLYTETTKKGERREREKVENETIRTEKKEVRES